MKKLLQNIFSIQKLELFDPYKGKLTNVTYYKVFGIVVKAVEFNK